LFSKAFWDRIGIALSGLCAIHCLFFPVTIALLPLLPVAESVHDWTHPALFLLIAPTVYFAVRSNGLPKSIPRLLYIGLAVIALAWMLHDLIGMWGESVVTIIGSCLLVTGHWMNYRHHQSKHKEICEV
jgi:vacuolar-type H+-ATPase subunit I/STV1